VFITTWITYLSIRKKNHKGLHRNLEKGNLSVWTSWEPVKPVVITPERMERLLKQGYALSLELSKRIKSMIVL
jgi:hypothetical protein